ncbi:MAG: hypothetical protein GW761_11005 [Leptospira sp.]|nr:hypothetical protein [Leptospira sp.]
MYELKTRIKTIIFLFICFTSIYFKLGCIIPNNSNTLPIIAQGIQAYTPESLGLPPEETNSTRASLPVISENEALAMEKFLQGLEDLDQMTDVALKQQSIEAWKTIQFAEMTDFELNDKIFREMKGETIPDKVAGTNAELLAKESNSADEFFNSIADSFPELSNEELIDIRIQLTVALVLIRLQIDFGDDEIGIPEEFLTMVRTKNVALRQKITNELIARGVTTL